MKNYLEYNGYIGTLEFSADDKIFFGKIQGINDLVTFEGSSVTELEESFKEAVDDYLETCKLLNRVPDKIYKGSFNVRVPQDLHQKIALLASRKGLNLNEIVKEALSYVVKHEEILN
ncbi:type II toxin-antitoxin system HicB family antitoxin [Flavobacterium reichenbachii]|uniref:DNA repair protein n=1 Tax=Flavobacterium reichenbachii TaxID=362418 RepID=A0A085ZLJ7_9FLAO|nr:type II toxin-antitoxin system HicB family antitoxin [Flavobacterium reichenbachii]KFF05311.1 DNA repair protein [Flavobacterium reichenbachii]OXB16022.1 DNA repair protein [Flavobacterium reichenbachii]